MKRADPFIDFLRALGILHVVLFHVIHGVLRFAPKQDIPDFLTRFSAAFGYFWQPVGVDLIFVVSTYLLARPLWREMQENGRIDLRRYFVKRVSRILPLYFLSVLLYGLAQGDDPMAILRSLTFVGYLVSNSNVVPVGWTMEVMMMIYLVLPLAVSLLSRTARPAMIVVFLFALSVFARWAYLMSTGEDATVLLTHLFLTGEPTPAGFELYFRMWFRLPAFLVGLALAIGLERQTAPKLPWMPALVVLTALIWFSVFLPTQSPDLWPYRVLGAGFFGFYWASSGAIFSLGTALAILIWEQSNKSLRFRGPWTLVSRNIFGIYLFHMPMVLIGAVIVFQTTDARVLGSAQLWQIFSVFGIAAVLSLGGAMLLNRWIETPAQNWLRRHILGEPL
ncbi:MAG: acyltransferase [Rhodobacteraceae bacterium]|nr:acyltransferase [Paracoccaceae bacterium]